MATIEPTLLAALQRATPAELLAVLRYCSEVAPERVRVEIVLPPSGDQAEPLVAITGFGSRGVGPNLESARSKWAEVMLAARVTPAYRGPA